MDRRLFGELTPEDAEIFATRTRYAADKAYIAAHAADCEVMAVFGEPGLIRGTLTPVSLATVGLSHFEWRKIGVELADEQDARKLATAEGRLFDSLHGVDVVELQWSDFEHITLQSRFDAVQASGTGLPGSIEEC